MSKLLHLLIIIHFPPFISCSAIVDYANWSLLYSEGNVIFLKWDASPESRFLASYYFFSWTHEPAEKDQLLSKVSWASFYLLLVESPPLSYRWCVFTFDTTFTTWHAKIAYSQHRSFHSSYPPTDRSARIYRNRNVFIFIYIWSLFAKQSRYWRKTLARFPSLQSKDRKKRNIAQYWYNCVLFLFFVSFFFIVIPFELCDEKVNSSLFFILSFYYCYSIL